METKAIAGSIASCPTQCPVPPGSVPDGAAGGYALLRMVRLVLRGQKAPGKGLSMATRPEELPFDEPSGLPSPEPSPFAEPCPPERPEPGREPEPPNCPPECPDEPT